MKNAIKDQSTSTRVVVDCQLSSVSKVLCQAWGTEVVPEALHEVDNFTNVNYASRSRFLILLIIQISTLLCVAGKNLSLTR